MQYDPTFFSLVTLSYNLTSHIPELDLSFTPSYARFLDNQFVDKSLEILFILKLDFSFFKPLLYLPDNYIINDPRNFNLLLKTLSPTIDSLNTAQGYFSSEFNDNSLSSHTYSVLQYTIPDCKLFYPEPFLASPSYMHTDLHFLHILQYWYWLWFLFIFLICFFFITFLSTIRWCNLRVKPRRETRGVSRSKCGDLITACVPIVWAISIIVYESTDPSDFNDGFGTGELIVGIRAYQWGWEYYYPKSIDLNYNVEPSYSSFIGNSLKYNYSSGRHLEMSQLWKFYQNKVNDKIVTPAHLLLLPAENSKNLNYSNFENIGSNTLKSSESFTKVKNVSKTFYSNLVTSPSTITTRYKNLNNLYVNDNNFLNSVNYGLQRQHNLVSPVATTNQYSSFLDLSSHKKSLVFNLGHSSIKSDFWNSPVKALPQLNKLTHFKMPSYHPIFTKTFFYPSFLTKFNNDSDKTLIYQPILKFFSSYSDKKFYKNFNQVSESSYSPYQTQTLYAHPTILPQFDTFQQVSSSGQNAKILPADQTSRQYSKLSKIASNFNLSESNNTVASNLLTLKTTQVSSSFFNNYLMDQSEFSDLSVVGKILSNRYFMVGNYPSILSSNPFIKGVDHSSMKTNYYVSYSNKNHLTLEYFKQKSSSVDLLSGSRERSPESVNSNYWNFFWSNSTPSLRLNPVINFYDLSNKAYFQLFTNYSEYDFKNDQTIDLFEDAYWETTFSSYSFYDYLNLHKNFKDSTVSDTGVKNLYKLYFFYPALNLETNWIKKENKLFNFYPNSIIFDENASVPNYEKTINSFLSPFLLETIDNEDAYNNYKSLLASPFSNLNTNVNVLQKTAHPQSYISIFNNFRGDFEDFSWWNVSNTQANLLEDYKSFFQGSRVSNPTTLRSSVRNSIVNYNAFQKVFRARFDENRSNINNSSITNLSENQPFLFDKKTPYLKLLRKNTESFFSTPFYKKTPSYNFNPHAPLITALNYSFFDFPFLLSQTSDVIRHSWLDWFSQWSYIEVQPSSVSRFSTLGVPYLRKPFDFNPNSGDRLQDTERYLTRISRSRRNFLPNWLYSPYLFDRFYVWNNVGKISKNLLLYSNNASFQKYSLKKAEWYWSNLFLDDLSQLRTTYSLSGDNIYGRSTFRPQSSIQSYYTILNHLTDLLSRRELIARQYFEASAGIIRLPNELTASPENSLIEEVKKSFLFIDPVNFLSENSRNAVYSSLSYFKFIYLSNLIKIGFEALHKLPLNTKLIEKNLSYYLFGFSENNVGYNDELYKNQFRPLRKGISSMLRLHATAAVALPVEIRLQVLASSRDVIHSWSVPSAGIKIDCVPGYTSHRIMLFLLSGVYWGQCQEICGRYHHWMPIVVYFMKRDLFFLWCTHFVFNSNSLLESGTNDKYFNNYLRFVSYNKSSWLSEIL